MVSPADTSTRKSGRKRKLNVNYSNDAFEDLDVLSDTEKSPAVYFGISDPDDDEFGPEEVNAELEDVEPDDLVMSEESDGAGPAGSQNVDDDGVSDDDAAIVSKEALSKFQKASTFSDIEAMRHAARANPKVMRGEQKLSAEGVRDRGVRQVGKNSSKDANLIYTFGSQKEDIEPLLKARTKWFNELTIPSRISRPSGEGGMSYTFYQTDDQRQNERTEGWKWYYEQGGRSSFNRRQAVKHLSADEANLYLRHSSCQFVAGRPPQQRIFTLGPGETMNLGQAWPVEKEASDTSRSGWLINTGDSADTLDWAPNRTVGVQYLAIGGSAKTPRSKGDNAFKAQTTPAFTPAPPMPSSIQIWEFASTASAGDTITISPITAPILRAVICLDWGPIKHFKWAPFHRQAPDHEPQDSPEHLGHLAILCGDGVVRILDIHLPTSPAPVYLHHTSAAFTSRPPDTLCTCLTWVTPQVLAAGCANGYLVAWNITAHLLSPSPPVHAHPAIYTPIHSSYILNISACLPSRPSLILTASLDGYQRLTSLTAPTSDAVTTQRARIGNPHILWLDAVQHVLTADDAYNVQVHNVRRLHTSTMLTRQSAPISALVGSAVHASVLVGQADGEVCVVNPWRKALHSTKAQPLFRQVWFRHEWRRGRAGKIGGRHAEGGVEMRDVEAGVGEEVEVEDRGQGLARLTTGFAVEQIKRAPTNKASSTADGAVGAGVIFTTIHEEKSGIKSLAWNPNLKAGGWAAAGTGTGLVWVEDIAWDG